MRFFFIKFKTRVNTKIGFKFVAARTLRRKLIEFINELRLEASHNSISSLFLSGREEKKTFVSRNWIGETFLATALKVRPLITFALKQASWRLHSSIIKNKFNLIYPHIKKLKPEDINGNSN